MDEIEDASCGSNTAEEGKRRRKTVVEMTRKKQFMRTSGEQHHCPDLLRPAQTKRKEKMMDARCGAHCHESYPYLQTEQKMKKKKA